MSDTAKKEKINNVKFEVSSASEFPGSGYDFVTFFDCLHDMGDPEGALTHTRNVIKKDDGGSDSDNSNNSGTCMIVEPFAQNELENNLNPIASTFLCCLYTNMCSKFISFQWTCTGSTSRRKQNKRCSNEQWLFSLQTCA